MRMELEEVLELFQASCKSEASYEIYKGSVNSFIDWLGFSKEVEGKKIHDYVKLLVLSEDEITEKFTKFLIFKRKRINPNSIQPIYSGIAKFLKANRKKFDKDYVKQFLPEKIKTTQGRPWSNEQIRKMLEFADSYRLKALIHFLSASFCRVGVVEELKIKHISEMGDGYKAVLVYAGSSNEYYTFLHPEAVKVLYDYFEEREKQGEKLTEGSPVFRAERSVLTKPMSRKGAQLLIIRGLSRAGIQRKKEENSPRFEIAIDHGFKDRGSFILMSQTNIPSHIISYFLDHKSWERTHYMEKGLTKEFLLEHYKKAVPLLMISEEERQKIKLKEQKLKITELEKNKNEIAKIQENVDVLTNVTADLLVERDFYRLVNEEKDKNPNINWQKVYAELKSGSLLKKFKNQN